MKEIKEQKEKLLNKYENKFNELKRKFSREKDEAIDNEINLVVQRLRN